MEHRFTDGNMSDVVRVGDVVRKQKGPWWDATHQVLLHLEADGYPWSPRVIEFHDDTVELSYVPGQTIPASLDGYLDDDLLITIGKRTRELHDALNGFHLSPGTECVPWPVEPAEKTIVCHNDLSPWNTVMDGNTFRGFIDWDLVSVATREWELAWICWRFAPIYPPGGRAMFAAESQANRCRAILSAYGTDVLDLNGFVDLIDMRMKCALEVVEQLGAQGVPGFDRLLQTGMHLSAHDDRAWLATNADVFSHLFASIP